MLTIFIRIICLLSWITVFFMPKSEIKRYFPVTILSGLFTVTVVLIGTHYNFWEVKGSSKKRMWNHLLLVLGPFAVGNLWIFHFTFRKFGLYLIVNLINNLLYGIKAIPMLKKAKYLYYVKFTRIHHIIVTMIESLILYRFQLWFDKSLSQKTKRVIQ